MTDPLRDLLPEYPTDLTSRIRDEIARSHRKLVAIDDDPTGVQTVHDTAVLADWTVAALSAELRDPRPVCFILTNSRSLPEAEAAAINGEIARNLLAASAATGVAVALASRSDSTLRGHFPAETDALAHALGGVDAVLIVPAFFEGGRLTAGDVHWVREGERLVPAAETEFARDKTFGYRSSNLRDWVAEKTGGAVPASAVARVSLADIRNGGPERVAEILGAATAGQPIVINAVSYRDLEVVVLGVLLAEAAGQRLLYRTGAGFVRVRAGLAERPLLTRAELVGAAAPVPLPGLVVVGSHVQRSSEQLAVLRGLANVVSVELNVPRLLDATTRDLVIFQARESIDEALTHGATPVLFTSRRVEVQDDPDAQLEISRTVSAALVAVVRGLTAAPGWVVGKGGITSSDIGTKALGERRAIVLGQIRPGVPVWRLGDGARYPGVPYVVFPGNVGTADTLADVVTLLRGE